MRFLNDALTKRYRQSVNGAIMSAIKSCVLKKRSWKKSVSLMSARGRKVVDAKKPLSRPQPIKLTLKVIVPKGGPKTPGSPTSAAPGGQHRQQYQQLGQQR